MRMKKKGSRLPILNCKVCDKEYKPHTWGELKKGQGLRCSIECRSKDKTWIKSGKEHWSWLGDNIKNLSLHSWINKNFKRPDVCDVCGKGYGKRLDWSNKNHEYNRDRDEWQYLCRSCHMKYDYEKGFRKPKCA